jgi:hypothetical protein
LTTFIEHLDFYRFPRKIEACQSRGYRRIHILPGNFYDWFILSHVLCS